MTPVDLELTTLCALAMGWDVKTSKDTRGVDHVLRRMPQDHMQDCWCVFDPLNDDAQAMTLVKKFPIVIAESGDSKVWVGLFNTKIGTFCDREQLNRAVVECVANIQKEK